MADIAQEDEWVMEKGIVAKMYMTPRQIKSYREGRWVEGVHYKKHSLTLKPLKEGQYFLQLYKN
jgi:hypothetical protein